MIETHDKDSKMLESIVSLHIWLCASESHFQSCNLRCLISDISLWLLGYSSLRILLLITCARKGKNHSRNSFEHWTVTIRFITSWYLLKHAFEIQKCDVEAWIALLDMWILFILNPIFAHTQLAFHGRHSLRHLAFLCTGKLRFLLHGLGLKRDLVLGQCVRLWWMLETCTSNIEN
jgi:hypothetical protein